MVGETTDREAASKLISLVIILALIVAMLMTCCIMLALKLRKKYGYVRLETKEDDDSAQTEIMNVK